MVPPVCPNPPLQALYVFTNRVEQLSCSTAQDKPTQLTLGQRQPCLQRCKTYPPTPPRPTITEQRIFKPN
ncbi:hypothetical protein Anapl_00319 [Anas platyrhynchos]|uniref:Uncharacterized protein n=1 Tax=Anas platyrhynchos TaxID=8839 RepID=R0M610_ANAPL|nr:hypothetical protein Anapl_00319 [Anas platyrhynchos]